MNQRTREAADIRFPAGCRRSAAIAAKLIATVYARPGFT